MIQRTREVIGCGMKRGYIRLWRKSLDKGWIKNHKLWALWTWSLLKATHKKYTAIVGGQEVTLMPGQFIFGRRIAAIETGLTEKEVRCRARYLIDTQNWASKRANKFSIVSIVNWETYQAEGSETGQQTGRERASKGPHTRTIEQENKSFDLFWFAYPRKVGKLKARKAWERISFSNGLFEKIMGTLEIQKASKQWETEKYIPHPTTWLNGKRWEDELEPAVSESRFY